MTNAMLAFYSRLVGIHSDGFVITAVAVCIVTGWLLATLLKMPQTAKPARRRYWLLGTSLVTGAGVWTTHFIAMLGYRPDLLLDYDGPVTVLSALVAVVGVGVPLAASGLVASWRVRGALGALAGLGIAAMHYTGMSAIQNCLQTYSLSHVLAACLVGSGSLALARGIRPLERYRGAICALFAMAVAGTHFIGVVGTEFIKIGNDAHDHADHIVLSAFVAAGAILLIVCTFGAMLMNSRLEAQESAYLTTLSTALENMSNGLTYFDRNDRLQLFNQRFLEMFGLTEGYLMLGMPREHVIRTIGEAKRWSEEQKERAIADVQRWIDRGHSISFDYAADERRVLEVEIRPVVGNGTIFTYNDVTKDRNAQEKIRELVYSDPLTKLANRRALNQRMHEKYETGQSFELLLLDLDRFKTVNDTYGHSVGDQLLVKVSERLLSIAGPQDFTARLGGDELAVVTSAEPDHVLHLGDKIVNALARPFALNDITISIGCSVGVCSTEHARDADELMQRADIALYESKHRGRGRVSRYKPGMLEAVVERQTLENDLHRAVERGEFHLVYQPVMALKDNRIIGFEALIRWNHPAIGAVSPARFIPLAEETGQIVQIGQWVLEEACRAAATWAKDLYVAVNVSAVQLRSPLLLAHLASALSKSGLLASRLELELTETAIVEDGAQIAQALNAVRALGVKVAMDDFGTGYSSLVHLRDFPVDRIKVDRSFVVTASTDSHSYAVLRGITQIAQDLGTTILAEGVETEEQLALIRAIGCDAVQGYLIGRPARDANPLETSEKRAISKAS